MDGKLKPYEEYKEVDLLWLDSIPKHWNIAQNSLLFREVVDTNNEGLELLSILMDKGIVKQSSTGRKNRMSQDNSMYKKICVGDIGYNLMNAFMGAIGVSKYEGIISPAYAVCRPRIKLNSWYYHYLFRTPLYKTLFDINSYGIMYERNRLYFDRFKKIKTLLPPIEEQDQIVRYLDCELTKINKLIWAKKRQIDLLKEKIDNITNRAITVEGINKQRLNNVSIRIGTWIERKQDKEYIPIGLLNRGRGIFHKSPIIGTDLGDSEFYEVENNALMFSGQFAWEGSVALTEKNDEKCIASHRYYMIRGIEGIAKNKYLWAFFRTKYGELLLNLNSRGAAGRNRPLNMNSLLKEYIPIPPMEVQEEISKEVDILLSFIKSVKQLEDFIKEYKTTLISNVVTGKVDVRNIKVEDVIEEVEEEIEDLGEENIE